MTRRSWIIAAIAISAAGATAPGCGGSRQPVEEAGTEAQTSTGARDERPPEGAVPRLPAAEDLLRLVPSDVEMLLGAHASVAESQLAPSAAVLVHRVWTTSPAAIGVTECVSRLFGESGTVLVVSRGRSGTFLIVRGASDRATFAACYRESRPGASVEDADKMNRYVLTREGESRRAFAMPRETAISVAWPDERTAVLYEPPDPRKPDWQGEQGARHLREFLAAKASVLESGDFVELLRQIEEGAAIWYAERRGDQPSWLVAAPELGALRAVGWATAREGLKVRVTYTAASAPAAQGAAKYLDAAFDRFEAHEKWGVVAAAASVSAKEHAVEVRIDLSLDKFEAIPDRLTALATLREGLRLPSAPGEATVGQAAETKKHVVSRAELERALADPKVFRKGARAVPSIRSGKRDGAKLYAIRPWSAYALLGFANGDTVHEIDGVALRAGDNEGLHDEMRSRFERGNATFSVSLTRRGRRIDLVIAVE